MNATSHDQLLEQIQQSATDKAALAAALAGFAQLADATSATIGCLDPGSPATLTTLTGTAGTYGNGSENGVNVGAAFQQQLARAGLYCIIEHRDLRDPGLCAVRLDNEPVPEVLLLTCRKLKRRSVTALQYLIPHLASARRFEREYAALQARHNALRRTLDRCDTGLFVVDAQSRLIHCNCAGAMFAGRKDVLSISDNGTLMAADSRVHADLESAIRRAASLPSNAGESIRMLRPDGAPVFVDVGPLHGRGDNGDWVPVAASVRVNTTTRHEKVAIDHLAAPHSLTLAETEVARLLVAGHSNSAIARRRGTSIDTVKTQATNVYRKTGAAGRVQLIRHALSVPQHRDSGNGQSRVRD